MDKATVFEFSLKNKDFKYLQDKCMEEMAELTKAFFKARERGEELSDDIEQEFADVSLMMKQVRYCYDHKTDGKFSRNIEMYERAKCQKLWAIWHDGIMPR